MDGTFVISLVVGVISMVLAIVAIWHSAQSEKKSTDNYNRTKDLLSAISQKAAVIEGTVSRTQDKLVDTVTSIASPRQESQDEILMKVLLPTVIQNPQIFDRLIAMAEQQSDGPSKS